MIHDAPAAPAPSRPAPQRLARLQAAAAADHASTLVLWTVLILVVLVMLALLPDTVHQDTWLALVTGREVWSGIPDHETLTLMAAGHRWVDEQWLSQLLMYGLWRAGGIGLVGLVHVALISSAIAGAAHAARRLGACTQGVMLVLPLTLCGVVLASEVRTQAYGYPLFVAILVLLAADSREPTRRVYWCLPLLVLWANLHGAATLGAGLVVLRGLTYAWERRRMLVRGAAPWGRPITLLVGAPACLLVTPFGTSILSYYHTTLLSGGLRRFVTEWYPVTSVPILAAVLFLMAGILIWSVGRHPQQTTLWERWALLALGIGGIMAVRNVQWFALAATVLLPLSIDPTLRARVKAKPRRPRMNLALAATAALAMIASAVAVLGRPDAAYERFYPAAARRAVAAATTSDPSLRVLADAKYADWLLWTEPSLRGRVAHDARFELLTAAQLKGLFKLSLATGQDWLKAARGYRLLVVDAERFADEAHALRDEPGRRILFDRGGTLVLLRRAEAAA